MIKKIIQLYLYEKKKKNLTTFQKFLARLKKYGLAGTNKRLDKEYASLKKDVVAYSIVTKKYTTLVTRLFFGAIFTLLALYFLVIKSELYESQTALMVRDLSSSSPTASLGLALLGAGSSSQLQDSMVVEEYLMSLDMLERLDKKFNLVKHFKSDSLDFVERLSKNATTEETLKFYQSRLHINYDETSAILHIAYAHTDPKTAQKVLEFLVKEVEHELNEFNRRKAKKQLKFIEREHDIKKKQMDRSAAILEEYQNKHLLLDPTAEASSSSTIIANLEATLTQKKIELKTKSNYLNPDNYEILNLKSEIKAIEHSLEDAKEGLAGDSEAPLNKILFKYEQLKMQLEFDTEVYKNTLLQLESIRLDALKNAKTLSIVSKPNLPDGYTYPNKPKVFITLVIVMLLLYGIFSMLIAIIKDHKE